MDVLLGFAPWMVFWVLVGNTPVLLATAVALAVAVAALLSRRAKNRPLRTLGVGTAGAFAVLVLVSLVAGTSFAQRWILPLGNAGLLAVTLAGVVGNASIVGGFVAADQPAAVVQSELFGPIVARLTRIWLTGFAVMTASSAIPPLLGDASMLDAGRPLAFTCYWVIPFTTLAAVAIASRIVPDRMTVGFDDAVRRTSFVAFVDMEIDQLYYLATEHANREVGPGQEAYNVTVGAKGTPLLGDDTRVSWPSTFKVRDRRR